MSTFYRIVKTNWSYKEVGKKTTDSLGVVYSSLNEAEEVLKSDVLTNLMNLNRGRESLPFRHSFCGDYDCIIRFWDGEDYRQVMAWDIHNVFSESNDINKDKFYKYRGFVVVPKIKRGVRTSLTITDGKQAITWRKSLQGALLFIDELCLSNDKRF